MHRAGSLARLKRESRNSRLRRPAMRAWRWGPLGQLRRSRACLGLYSATPAGAFRAGPRARRHGGSGRRRGQHPFTRRPKSSDYPIRRLCHARHADARYLHPLPAGWSIADGAALPVQAITAWYAISELGACKRGDAVLVQSGRGRRRPECARHPPGIGARAVATVGQESPRSHSSSPTPASTPADHRARPPRVRAAAG